MLSDAQPVGITPKQFEVQVCEWFKAATGGPENFTVAHSHTLEGDSGEYEIDIMIQFEVFGSALINVLVECKRYKNPVKRDVIMVLESKIRDSCAHKGMVFSTSGFQRGAIGFAQNRGIATVTVQHGATQYLTRSPSSARSPTAPQRKTSSYVGWFMSLSDEGRELLSRIDDHRQDALVAWLIDS